MASGGRIPAKHLTQFIDEFNTEIRMDQHSEI